MVIGLVGNKLDLEADRTVQKEEAEKLAQENGMVLLEASANTGENVIEIFEQLAKQIVEIVPETEEKPKPNDGEVFHNC